MTTEHCGPQCQPCDFTTPVCSGGICRCDGTSCGTGNWCDGGACDPCDTAAHCGPGCVDCTPGLQDKDCVSDSCGCNGNEDCSAPQICNAGTARCCNPDCTGKCGGASNGCGGTCTAACPSDQWCNGQVCSACDDNQHCGSTCADCSVQGSNKVCVSGACGCNSASDCGGGETCNDDQCSCVPNCTGKCGGAPDGCDGTCIANCLTGQWCSNQNCTACDVPAHCGPGCAICSGETPDCGGASVGCVCNGGSCGVNETCDASGQCVCANVDCNGTCCAQEEQCIGNQCATPSTGKIAFVSNKSGFYEIWVINDDGTSLKQLTSNAGDARRYWGAFSPRWSPDGSQIAFYYGMSSNSPDDAPTTRVMVMNQDGSDLQQICSGFLASGDQLSWNTNSAKIYISTYGTCNAVLYEIDIATGSKTVVVDNSSNGYQNPFGPEFDPTGQNRIAYRAYNCGGNNGGLRLHDLATHAETEITPPGDCMYNPRFSADGTQLVGPTACAGVKAFYTVGAEGGTITTITPTPAPPANINGYVVDWTATGFLFAAGSDLWTCGADGSGAKAVLSNGYENSEPDWFPRRLPMGQIVFLSNRSGYNEVWIMNEDGTNQRKLTFDATGPYPNDALMPRWSHDGTRIAFVYGQYLDYGIEGTLNLVPPGGGSMTLVKSAMHYYWGMTWAWDDSDIIYHDSTTWGCDNSTLRAIKPDGTGDRFLYDEPNYQHPQSVDSSPVGLQLAYAAYSCGGNEGGIWKVNYDGTGRTQLTVGGHHDYYPRWSPSGTRIVYYTDSPGEIWLMNADGSDQHMIFNVFRAGSPDWMGENRIVFSGTTGDPPNRDIYSIATDGSDLQRLTTDPGQDFEPDWAPGSLPAVQLRDHFDSGLVPDATIWAEYDYSSTGGGSGSNSLSGSSLRAYAATNTYGWTHEHGVYSRRPFSLATSVKLVIETKLRPPASHHESFVFFSTTTGNDTYIRNDCNPGYCGATNVGTGKIGFGFSICLDCNGPVGYRVVSKSVVDSDNCNIVSNPAAVNSTTDWRVVRLEITPTTFSLIESGTVLFSGPNPVPSIGAANVFLAAFTDRTGFETEAFFDEVVVSYEQ